VWWPLFEQTSAHAPKARAYHTLTADSTSKSLFLFGGNDDQNSMSELHVFNTQTEQWWTPNTSGTAPSARIGASSLFVQPAGGAEGGGRLVLFGGWDYSNGAKDTYFADVHVLDTGSWHWSAPPASTLAPSPRAGMQMAMATERSCIVFGGRDEEEDYVMDTWQLFWQLPGQAAEEESAAAAAGGAVLEDAGEMSGVFDDPDDEDDDDDEHATTRDSGASAAAAEDDDGAFPVFRRAQLRCQV
jgi:hypothetical protein